MHRLIQARGAGQRALGGPISGLTVKEGKFFNDGQTRFQEVEGITKGLGPRFNLNSCAGCHAQPTIGGSSPSSNPQVTVAPPGQYANVSSFILPTGPIREVRFESVPGVHDHLRAC
jgi:hypothetical protein